MFQNINSVCFSEIVDFKPCLNLVNVTKKDESVSATTKTGYMEALIRLLQQTDNDSKDREMGLRMREVMMCLRLPLTNDKEELRSSTLKLVRYLVRSEKDVHAETQVDKKIFCPYFNPNICQVNLHHFIVRSLDQDLKNRPERIQAVKLVRKLLVFGSGQSTLSDVLWPSYRRKTLATRPSPRTSCGEPRWQFCVSCPASTSRCSNRPASSGS